MCDLDKELNGLAIDDEEITARHRKQRKELQAKIQALKKTIGKKNKKEVLDEIARLEFDLNQKHDNELAESTKKTTIETATATNNEESAENVEGAPTVRVSRAQKRREKKAIDEKAHQAEILAQDEANKTGQRALEIGAIKKLLAQRDLELFPIASDGNCLYNAIRHQLNMNGRIVDDVETLRRKTSDYILLNKDSLIFYMTNPATGDCLDDAGFKKYCEDLRNTAAWGGHVEISVLSNILALPIEVIQATGPTTIQGEHFKGPPLIITYHRHMYSLGEHYNGTSPRSADSSDFSDDAKNQP